MSFVADTHALLWWFNESPKLSRAALRIFEGCENGARHESNRLLNDQGFAALSIAVSNVIADIAEHPERLVKEFAH